MGWGLWRVVLGVIPCEQRVFGGGGGLTYACVCGIMVPAVKNLLPLSAGAPKRSLYARWFSPEMVF